MTSNDGEDRLHLTVAGFISHDRTIEIDSILPWVGSLPNVVDAGPSPDTPTMSLRLLDAQGRRLGESRVGVVPWCALETEPGGWLFLGGIALPRRSRVLEWDVDEQTVLRSRAPRVVDGLQLTWPPAGFEGGGQHEVRWDALERRAAMRFALSYSWDGGSSWLPLGLPSEETSCWVDFDSLPGGEHCLLQLRGGSERALTVTLTEPFAVTRKGIQVSIEHLPDGAQVADGIVHLRGEAYDMERRRHLVHDLEWLLNDVEPLGLGSRLMAALPGGDHWITLRHRPSGATATTRLTSTE